MSRVILALLTLSSVGLCACPALALDRPWISDVFFYWYTWDYQQAWGGWEGGVYYTPLVGYYDSRTYEDNLRELWMASEWGMTHHFMDYWDPNWKANTGEPRDLILMRASQALADRGYNIWMSYYQDGSNFAMRDFARNVTEKRDVWNWLKNYAPFKVWPRLNGRPFQLVYSRNGAPELTADDKGFHAFLKQRYKSIDGLRKAWGEPVISFDEITVDFGATGPRRADAIDYQYVLWEKDWARLNEVVRREFGYPGLAASFDVGYGPFRNFSYGDFARVFGGPHSYGGIFGQPHEQDAQRFIQSIVAKKYGTVFFDHLKHTYCDWNTAGRIPGTEYPLEPCHFDRFWVGNLMRCNEAVLHLSWNEWWEGSNLEPSLELGKAYCEKNLLYSTIMQWCFPSLRDFGKGASVGVLLNDWAFKCGARDVDEIYFAIQEMRRTMLPFDLLVDDLVTAKELERFDLIIAPAAGIGFGCNRQRERIADLLKQWVEGGKNRCLVVSACPEFAAYLGLKPKPSAQIARRGLDINVFVDVGIAPNDEQFLVGGRSFAEDWGKLPADKFGASPSSHTVRWTPGSGRTTTLLLPCSPSRDHILRLSGDAMRPSTITVRIGGTAVGTIDAQEGRHEYQAAIPAAAISGARMVKVELVYDRQIVPGQIDPQRYPGEQRACNLALDWLQFCTSNIGPSREQKFQMPGRSVRFASARFGDLKGRSTRVPWRVTSSVAPSGGEVLSTYEPDGNVREMLFARGGGKAWYVNGRLDDVADPRAFAAIIGALEAPRPQISVTGKNVMGACLKAGTTDVLLAYNEDIQAPASISVGEGTGDSVAEVSVLSRDGKREGQVVWRKAAGGRLAIDDRIRYYGVYQVVRAPVRIEHEPLVLVVGERKAIAIRLKNITARRVDGTIELASVIPTVATDGKAVRFSVPARRSVTIALPIRAKETADCGLKTVALKVKTGTTVAYFWRTLRVLPLPGSETSRTVGRPAKPAAGADLALESHGLGTGSGTVRVENSFFEVVLSEARGGTVTTFRSKKTGNDYAADSFGAAYGEWGKSDPLKPAHNAAEYIIDKRVHQRDMPAAIEVVSATRSEARVRVTWSDAGISVSQMYRFSSSSNRFEVMSTARPKRWRAGDELVVLDCRFKRSGLTKIYPGFSGQPQVFGQSHPHFGWRQVPRVPEYASLLAPLDFAEGVSIIPLSVSGIDRWRQGFWPEKRPDPGPCKYAQVEFAATNPDRGGASAEVLVMLHPGSHTVAKQAAADLQCRPVVLPTPIEKNE